jgi:hypothetical protein
VSTAATVEFIRHSRVTGFWGYDRISKTNHASNARSRRCIVRIACFAVLLVDAYRELAFRVGLLFPHHRDTADLLEAGGAGFAVLAVAMVVAGVLFERLFRSLWHGTRESAE